MHETAKVNIIQALKSGQNTMNMYFIKFLKSIIKENIKKI